jgi:transposase-like protein
MVDTSFALELFQVVQAALVGELTTVSMRSARLSFKYCAWAEFTPFLNVDPEIRAVICTTNAIESLGARFRRAVKARGIPERAGRAQVPIPGHL